MPGAKPQGQLFSLLGADMQLPQVSLQGCGCVTEWQEVWLEMPLEIHYL